MTLCETEQKPAIDVAVGRPVLEESIPAPVLTNRPITLWPVAARLLRLNLSQFGATGTEVWVWSFAAGPMIRRVTLDHAAFAHVTLTLEQFNLLVSHLRKPSSSETVFVMAQSIEDGGDIGLSYDAATGVTHTPRARRKAVAA